LNKSSAWQTALTQAVTDPLELLTLLELDLGLLESAKVAAHSFPLLVPRGFLARMQKGNLKDPLLRQVLPLGIETSVPSSSSGYEVDPLQESKFNPIPGLLHKYQGRVLLTLVGTCAINCRFCFRRHFPYAENNPGSAGWEKALNYIAKDPSISEVILSGGDPLIVTDRVLQAFTDRLNDIPHIQRLRIHSRLPIVLPERITPELIQWISQLKQKPVLITHCNHPQEINHEVKKAILALKEAGVVLFNQSVLLKGVNDSVETLVALSEALFEIGLQPYYLHTLDKVQGTAHFDLDLQIAQKLHSKMNQQLPGYLVPKLVCEQAGALAKISLEAQHANID
jgi:EF-P beta-lysylation protein EpmB